MLLYLLFFGGWGYRRQSFYNKQKHATYIMLLQGKQIPNKIKINQI